MIIFPAASQRFPHRGSVRRCPPDSSSALLTVGDGNAMPAFMNY